MKLIFVVPRFHTNLATAVQSLQDAGSAIHLVTASPGKPEGPDLDLPQPITLPEGVSLTEALKLLRDIAPDLVVIRKTPSLARPFYRAALLLCIPTLGYDQRPLHSPRRWFSSIKGVMRGRPKRRITPTLGLNRTVPADPDARYLPFPVTISPTAPTPRPGPLRVLCVGKLAEQRKRPFLLIGAIEKLAQEGNVTLTLVGSSSIAIDNPAPEQLESLRAYARLCQEGGALAERFTLCEDVPFAHMSALYAAHDVCVLPSTGEPLGSAPIEALGQGAAAIVSSGTGVAGTIAAAQAEGYACGAVVEDGSPDALAHALRRLMGDGQARFQARYDAWRFAQEQLSPERFARDFLAYAASVACR